MVTIPETSRWSSTTALSTKKDGKSGKGDLGPPGWLELLDQMEKKNYKGDLDVFPNVSKSDKLMFWSEYGKITSKDERYEHTCYARLVCGNTVGRDLLIIQYWYAYLYNDFWNVHEMDWETVMVVLEGGGQCRPLLCAYSAHEGGHWLPWREVEKANDGSVLADTGTHPIVYVASGSHANYFSGPAIFRAAPPVLKMVTQIVGKPLAKLFPKSELAQLLNQVRQPLDYTASLDQVGGLIVNAKIMPDQVNGAWEGEWRWLNHTGRWGSPGEWIGLGDAGPHGPPHTGEKWADPLWWIDADCTRAPARENVTVPTRAVP